MRSYKDAKLALQLSIRLRIISDCFERVGELGVNILVVVCEFVVLEGLCRDMWDLPSFCWKNRGPTDEDANASNKVKNVRCPCERP